MSTGFSKLESTSAAPGGGDPILEEKSWAVSNLALGYLRHCWETGEAGDVRAYLEAVHHASGIYLEQLERG